MTSAIDAVVRACAVRLRNEVHPDLPEAVERVLAEEASSRSERGEDSADRLAELLARVVRSAWVGFQELKRDWKRKGVVRNADLVASVLERQLRLRFGVSDELRVAQWSTLYATVADELVRQNDAPD